MGSLKEICAGLPLDPLPPKVRERDSTVPHAPTRTPNLSASEERVSAIKYFYQKVMSYIGIIGSFFSNFHHLKLLNKLED